MEQAEVLKERLLAGYFRVPLRGTTTRDARLLRLYETVEANDDG
jgi:hypothetical protein